MTHRPLLKSHDPCNMSGNGRCVVEYVRLPETDDRPSSLLQSLVSPTIAINVRLYLAHPVWRVVPVRQLFQALLEVATMPKVTVAEDNHTLTSEDYVGPARQIGHVDPVA